MNPHTLFSLIPRIRTAKPRTSGTALALVILVAIAAIGAIIVISGSEKAVDNSMIATQPSLKTLLQSPTADVSSTVYYAMKTNNKAETSIYQLSFDPSQPDTLITQHNGDLHFFDTNTQRQTWIAGDEQTLYMIDPDKKNIESVLKAPDGFRIYGAKFSHDTRKIAYTIEDSHQSPEGKLVNAATIEMHVFDIASQKDSKVLDQNIGRVYIQKPKNIFWLDIDAWSQDDSKIIGRMKEINNEGNPIDKNSKESTRFVLDLNDKNKLRIIELKTPEEQTAFKYAGVISPDGRYIASTYCGAPAKDGSCPAGVRILLFDIETGATTTVHRYDTDTDGITEGGQGKANIIFSLAWSHNSAFIFFATLHGIFRVNVEGGTPETTYTFNVVQSLKQPVSLTSMERYLEVSFADSFPINTKILLDTSTNKFLTIPKPSVTDASFLQFLTY